MLDTLRQSNKPLTTRDLAQHVMAERELNTSDKRLVQLVGKRVGACLRHQRGKGTMRSKPGPGQHLLWSVNQWGCYIERIWKRRLLNL